MQAINQLITRHNAFRSFVARQVGREDTAEDILQSAYAKAMQRQHQIRNEETVVAWFYRLLRNAIADHYRRAAVEKQRIEYDNDADLPVAAPQIQSTACECVLVALDGLKPNYADALREVDIAGTTVQSFAHRQGITPDNASVRLHRARKALAREVVGTCGVCAEHKCVDCDCRSNRQIKL